MHMDFLNRKLVHHTQKLGRVKIYKCEKNIYIRDSFSYKTSTESPSQWSTAKVKIYIPVDPGTLKLFTTGILDK